MAGHDTGDPVVFLTQLENSFNNVADYVDDAREHCTVIDFIDYQNDQEITFRGHSDSVPMDRIIDDLNLYRALLKKVAAQAENFEFGDMTDEKAKELARDIIKKITGKDSRSHNQPSYLSRAEEAKEIAAAGRGVARNPDYAVSAQRHLKNLPGVLRPVCDDLNELKSYINSIANWSALMTPTQHKDLSA